VTRSVTGGIPTQSVGTIIRRGNDQSGEFEPTHLPRQIIRQAL
jgi:hypothetical protein